MGTILNETNNPHAVEFEVPILRSVNKTIEEIKSRDPNSQINARMLRNAIRNGEIKARKTSPNGKYVLDLNAVFEYYGYSFANESSDSIEESV